MLTLSVERRTTCAERGQLPSSLPDSTTVPRTMSTGETRLEASVKGLARGEVRDRVKRVQLGAQEG